MAKIQEYKCPSCGGGINFDSTAQKMKCPYCDTEFDVETQISYDQDLSSTSEEDKIEWEKPGQYWQEGDEEGMRLYSCTSCGGQIIGDETLGATSCPYCGNPVVLMGQFAGDLKPDIVIPFKLDKEAAKKRLLEHYKGKPFIPKSFIEKNHIEEIKGVYVPYWLFNTKADGTVRYKATNIRTWRDSRNMYTETTYYSVVREGTMSFVDVPTDGSSKMPDDMMESIEPFDMSEAVDFQTAYLSGYLAERYDVDSDASTPRINERVKRSTEDMLASTVSGYTTVTVEDSVVNTHNGQIRYALMPVWMLNTKWNGQTYTFAMNGQTGKMVGDIPVDNGRFIGRLALIGGIAAAVVFGIQVLLNLGGIF